MAIRLLFQLFDPRPSAVGDYRNRSHPHPAVRLRNAYLTSMGLAESTSKEAKARTKTSWLTGLQFLGSTCHALGVPAAAISTGKVDKGEIDRECQFLTSYQRAIFIWPDDKNSGDR